MFVTTRARKGAEPRRARGNGTPPAHIRNTRV
jgi:hypothetical protein